MDYVEPDFSQANMERSQGSQHGLIGMAIGLIVLIAVAMSFAALASWSANDPSLSNANANIIRNWLGFWGASFADIMIQFWGLGAALALVPPAVLGWLFITKTPVRKVKKRLMVWPVATLLGSAAIACTPVPETWPLQPRSLGGIFGDWLSSVPNLIGSIELSGWSAVIAFAVFCVPAFFMILYASGLINRHQPGFSDADLGEDEAMSSSLILGALAHWYYTLKFKLFSPKRTAAPVVPEPSIVTQGEFSEGRLGRDTLDKTPSRVGSALSRMKRVYRALTRPDDDGLEGFESAQPLPRVADLGEEVLSEPDLPDYGEHIYDAHAGQEPVFETQLDAPMPNVTPQPAASVSNHVQTPQERVKPKAMPPRQSARVTREAQASLFDNSSFELPSLHFLGEPKNLVVDQSLTTEALEQNARLLEGVLQDFGVKGEIINVRPGPVVTLYELEPAPGIKSSRVIGLADDIARSMSAIAARVAVVPGRNAIGIELPNHRRETVYLRETLASQDYEKAKAKLPLVLGKNIGGEPVITDLAKMPHLLVAGTTGSGKSVAINTMILSILYRLSPEQVRMIMIDPKMLELSIYDGIPHLLTPVVTDPKKAVVALKWTVREMEERYKNMSKLGVRNIDGYNQRLEQARAKGEAITKTVQTGYDRESGEAIFETEELDLTPMPYIVVLIDEMADLMMVAGKDIEGTVQRLAQMARAAGIHVIMATQRPSVDVITGTIKANFPTRISFQVTSKIDSRTILGEQGAEQLLGMGDMLYMAGGGRIQRVHGPFVADEEVEQVVNHLKTQGVPQYLESVTEETEEDAANAAGASGEAGGLGNSDDPYDQAVAIVLRDRKVSTSYIQRRLSIGYNRAASLIERMEQEGLISAANHAGKREILVPGEDETI